MTIFYPKTGEMKRLKSIVNDKLTICHASVVLSPGYLHDEICHLKFHVGITPIGFKDDIGIIPLDEAKEVLHAFITKHAQEADVVSPQKQGEPEQDVVHGLLLEVHFEGINDEAL